MGGTLKQQSGLSRRFLDLCYLVGAGLLVCVLGGGAFVIAETHHISPLWVFFSLISIGFIAGAREEYRREFRSFRFVLFVGGWLVVNLVVIVAVLGFLGWLYLIPALLLEQFFFYRTAYWLFGLQPPMQRRH